MNRPILQMRKWRIREAKGLSQGYVTRQQVIKRELGSSALESVTLSFTIIHSMVVLNHKQWAYGHTLSTS